MSSADQQNYLQSKILTAPPHRLHLTLIEGAIRFGRQAEDALRHGDQVAAGVSLLRTLDVVGEMLAGVRANKSELNEQIADFYLFLFRTVAEAKINGDAEKMAEALRLLEYERETWQLVCEKLAAESAESAPPATSAAPRPLGAAWRGEGFAPLSADAGLSLEA